MRVLNCLHRSHPGGAHWRVAWVADALRANGIETTVLLPSGGGDLYTARLRDLNIPVERVFLPGIRRSALSNLAFVVTLPFVVFVLARLIRGHRIDVLHVNGVTNIQPVVAARLTGRPVLWHLNDMQTPRWFVRRALSLMRGPKTRLLVASDALVSHYDLDDIQGVRWEWMPAPAPVAGSRIGGPVSKSDLGISAEARVLGFVGNLVPVKGCNDFLDAVIPILGEDDDVHAVIVGPSVPRHEAYAHSLHVRARGSGIADRIHFVGYQANVASWLRMFDVFVFPSYSEACPIVVLEAMQEGVPVVATRVGEVPRMLEGTGLDAVEPGDVAGLTKGIIAALGFEQEQRSQLAVLMQESVERSYSLAAVARLHQRAYSVWSSESRDDD